MTARQGKQLRPSAAVLAEDVSLGLGEEIRCFDVPRLGGAGPNDDSAHQATVADLEHVASYSWLNETVPVPAMAVPGMPPIWREPERGLQLHNDRVSNIGNEQDANVVPKWPLLALVAAVRHERGPEYPLKSVDIITARNSLRRLLRWIRSGGRRSGSFEFRIDVDIVGRRTMLLSRRELRDSEPHVRRAHGHGLAFERAATYSEDDSDGNLYMRYMGYNRIVRYTLNGLSMMVRCEVDACVQSTASATGISHAKVSSAALRDLETQMADLGLSSAPRLGLSSNERLGALSPQSSSNQSEATTSLLRSPESSMFSFYGQPSAASSMSSIDVSSTIGDDVPRFSPSIAKQKPAPTVPIRIVPGGRKVDQRDLVELTTCFSEQFPRWDEHGDQLFLSGVSRLHVGFYDKAGVLTDVRKYTPGHYNLTAARKKHAESYSRLAALLREVRERALESGEPRLSLACLNGRLALYRRSDDKVALPAQYLAMFDC